MAEAETEMARRELAAAELTVIEQVKRAYYELYFIQKAIRITEDDKKLLIDLSAIAESKYRTGTVSQQDVLRSQVEVSSLNGELIRLRQQLESGQARLAQVLHISPDTPIRAVEQLPGEQVPRDLERLYQQAVAARPELQAQLAAVQRDRPRRGICPGWQTLPILPLRWAGWEWPPRGAVVGGRWRSRFGRGCDGQCADLPTTVGCRSPARPKRTLWPVPASTAAACAIRPCRRSKTCWSKPTARTNCSTCSATTSSPSPTRRCGCQMSAYAAGTTDFLQLIDNWRQLLRFQIAYRRLESQLQQSMASLERCGGRTTSAGSDGCNGPEHRAMGIRSPSGFPRGAAEGVSTSSRQSHSALTITPGNPRLMVFIPRQSPGIFLVAGGMDFPRIVCFLIYCHEELGRWTFN